MKSKIEVLFSLALAVLLGLAASTSINVGTQVFGICPVANGCTGVTTATAGTVFAGPASGSAAAPTFRILNLTDSSGLPRPDTFRWAYIVETGTTLQFAGDGNNNQYAAGTVTHNLADANNLTHLRCEAGLNLNNSCNWQSANGVGANSAYFPGKDAYYQTYMALTVGAGSGGDNERIWLGLADQTGSTMDGSDNPAGNYYAFRYSSAADSGNWNCVTKDGTTQTVSSSGVTVDTNYHLFEFVADDSVPSVTFKIDGSSVCTITTHLPTTAMRWIQSIRTTAAGATHATKNAWWFIRSDQ